MYVAVLCTLYSVSARIYDSNFELRILSFLSFNGSLHERNFTHFLTINSVTLVFPLKNLMIPKTNNVEALGVAKYHLCKLHSP